ncbi:Colicin E3 [Pseudomonas chlororaphis subsp. aurantiaca]|nr:Colicin E3 [Pseudomonas chlororaphis subsp. aurantiaca]
MKTGVSQATEQRTMARNKDVPQVWQRYDADGGGYRRLRDMTASELAERD